MSDPGPEFGPFAFAWTAQEARIAASRLALRRALAGGLIAWRLAPLAAFVLAMAFTAILALTDLISRRRGEIALLLEVSAFMIHRIWMRRLFVIARRESTMEIEAIRNAGEVVAQIDAEGLSLRASGLQRRWLFSEIPEVEDAGGMIYLWPRTGAPAFLPTRIFPDGEAARAFVAFARGRTSKVSPPRS